MKISVVGLGYVGLSISVLISQKYKVLALDIDEKKIDLVNNKKSPFKDSYIEEFLKNKKLDLTVSRDKELVFKDSEYLVIATPTNYSIETGSFNTESVESVIKDYLEINKKGTIVIKSTIPLNFTNKMRKKYSDTKIFFSPEFLRESNALYDNLYPSRIIVGDYTDEAKKFANILLSCSHENDENKCPWAKTTAEQRNDLDVPLDMTLPSMCGLLAKNAKPQNELISFAHFEKRTKNPYICLEGLF